MKIIYSFLVIALYLVVFSGCDFLDDLKKDQPSEFSIDYLEDEAVVYAKRDNTINIKVKSDIGINKVEIRKNFQLIAGSEQSFNGDNEADYVFNVVPSVAEIGQSVEYAIVAFNTDGYAITRDLTLTVERAPSLVKVLIPPTVPTEISYNDTVQFSVPFSSSTVLSEILIKYGDEILLDKSSDFASPSADIVDFYYDKFDVLQPGKNVDFNFEFIGIAPINETMYDTTKVIYSVFVKGPRIPLPVSEARDVQLGFQSNVNVPQFINLESGEFYFYLSSPYGAENSDKVDLGFYRSGSNKLCLANPVESGASTFIYKDATYGFDAWSTRNQTGFVKIIDSELLDETKFNNASTDELFYEAYDTAPVVADTFKKLAAGDIIVFKTVDGKLGAILIKSYIDSSSGTVDFTYKIQE